MEARAAVYDPVPDRQEFIPLQKPEVRILGPVTKLHVHFGASAVGAHARRRDAGDAGVDRRGAATKQMPPRRRAPPGCGPQARWPW